MPHFVSPSLVPRSLLSLSAMGLLSLLLSGCGDVDEQDTPHYQQLRVAPLVLQPSFQLARQFVGRAEASQRVTLGFELAGSVVELAVKDGDRVEAGQLLAQLDTRLLRSELEQLRANQEELEARRTLVELQIARQSKLKSSGFAAEQRLDELRAEAAVISAQLKRQRALVSAVQTRLDKSRLLAPYAGSISRRRVDEQAVVAAGQPVLDLLQSGVTELRVGLPVAMTRALTLGEDYPVLTAGELLSAQLLAVGERVDPVTRTVSTRLALPDKALVADGELLAMILMETRQSSGFWVPVSALNDGVRGTWNVLIAESVANDSNKRDPSLALLQSRSVTIHHFDEQRAYISGAIVDGEQLVVAGGHKVASGLLVQVQAAPEPLMNPQQHYLPQQLPVEPQSESSPGQSLLLPAIDAADVGAAQTSPETTVASGGGAD